jgi:hypothetical protein
MPSPRQQQITTTTPPVPSTTDAPGPPTSRTVGRESAPPARGLMWAAAGVTLVSLAGALLAVSTGLSASWSAAVGPTARLSVPLPMNVAVVVLALAAAGTRRRLALAAAILLALACAAAVVSGFFDGGYAAALAPVERLSQVALVAGLAALSVLAARRAVRLMRR